MAQAMTINDLLVGEEVRVDSLKRLVALLEQAERQDLDREEFAAIFSLSMRTLELDQETVAQRFKISRPTISRWESGKSAPHPIGRKPVFQLLRQLAKEKLRQHAPSG